MDARFQRRIQRYGWDEASGSYETYWARQLEPAQRRLLEMADPQPGERVLDIACGTGLVTFPIAEAVGAEGEVVGVDLSGEMIERVRREAERRGVDNVTFARMDAEELDLPDGSFDVVLCSLGLMYVLDPPKALAEMHRVLRPGGRAVAAVWGRRDRCGWAEVFPITDRRVRSSVCPLFFQLGSGDLLEQDLRGAGFTDVSADRFTSDLEYDSNETAVGAAFDGGPVALAYKRFDDETRQAVRTEYLESIQPYRREGGGFTIPGEFVVASGARSPEG